MTVGHKLPSVSNMVVPGTQRHSSVKGRSHIFTRTAEPEGWLPRANGTGGYLGRKPGVYITVKLVLLSH